MSTLKQLIEESNLYTTEENIKELAAIASDYVILDSDDQPLLTQFGVIQILKRYEQQKFEG